MSSERIGRFAAVAAVTGAVLAATSAPATASNYLPVDLPMTSTAAHGPGCGGEVWGGGNVYPDGDVPGTVDLQLKGWLKVFGIPAPWCSVTATVHWRNLDTGAAGAGSVSLGQGNGTPFFWAAPQLGNIRLITGAGRVTFTLTTDLPHTGSTTTFTVY
ncbi:hypothetical protein [Nocardia sp. NPDC051750]|uniref:hypothetical protein n=1 Tax=Nocardia sp. NPDC051750 TaxID=3364325 RepID=UPI0037B13B30